MQIKLESTSFTTTKREAPLSESLARLLFKRKDFRHETCHQLLQIVSYQNVARDCLSSSSPSAGSLTLGYFSHGRQQGLTRATRANQALLKYVNAYLRYHGLQGRTSSVFIGKNIRSRFHKDVHNSKSVDNWSVALCDYVGGRLWIEEEYDGANPGDLVKRSIKGKKVLSKFHDNYGKVIRFNPDLYHGAEDYIVITAYQTRLADQAPEQDLKELEKLGFRPRCRHVAFTTTASTDKEQEPAKVLKPIVEVFPSKEQTAAGQEAEKVIAMESSSDEDGYDGSSGFGARRAAQQARKKEIHWQAMSDDEIQPFIEALQREWAEWQRWSSCAPVHLQPGSVASHLILRSGYAIGGNQPPPDRKLKHGWWLRGSRIHTYPYLREMHLYWRDHHYTCSYNGQPPSK